MLRARLASRRGGFALAVELEVEPGRTLALVGESGAGKTTLLRLLAGLDTPDEGYVEVDGAAWLVWEGSMHAWSPARYAGRRELARGPVTVITPRCVVEVIRAGYRPAVHPSAG